jgi:hypothetical protein
VVSVRLIARDARRRRYPIPGGRRAKIFTAEDAESAETKIEGKRERIGDRGLIASLVFSAFLSAFSASSAVRNERRFSPQRTQRAQRQRPRERGSGLEMEG